MSYHTLDMHFLNLYNMNTKLARNHIFVVMFTFFKLVNCACVPLQNH